MRDGVFEMRLGLLGVNAGGDVVLVVEKLGGERSKDNSHQRLCSPRSRGGDEADNVEDQIELRRKPKQLPRADLDKLVNVGRCTIVAEINDGGITIVLCAAAIAPAMLFVRGISG